MNGALLSAGGGRGPGACGPSPRRGWACAVPASGPLLAACPRFRATEQVRVESAVYSEVCPGFAVPTKGSVVCSSGGSSGVQRAHRESVLRGLSTAGRHGRRLARLWSVRNRPPPECSECHPRAVQFSAAAPDTRRASSGITTRTQNNRGKWPLFIFISSCWHHSGKQVVSPGCIILR